MTFSIAQLIEARQMEQYPLHLHYVNPSLARVQAISAFGSVLAEAAHGSGRVWSLSGQLIKQALSQ